MHLTVWPSVPGLTSILNRLHSLLPTTVDIQTHLLHLASNGRILPHVDNVEASGTWIFGVSLGSERILRMMGPGNNDNFDVVLPSGSVYLQRSVSPLIIITIYDIRSGTPCATITLTRSWREEYLMENFYLVVKDSAS